VHAEDLDVLVVGAGISGIAAGYHLQTECPQRTWAIVERRESLGGTWDLFRYPGIRSDSDMHTLGFRFRPWRDEKAIADGPSILAYLRDTAHEYGIDRRIRYGLEVTTAAWDGAAARWTVEARRTTGETVRFRCRFLFMCSGYYDYEAGYTPELPGRERFRGRIVHPQRWTDDVDYAGKRVIVIGSGATAITLVPALAARAAHVTMLQRSPTWIVGAPAADPISRLARRALPERLAYGVTRWKNILFAAGFFHFCRRWPRRARALLLRHVRASLGPDYDVATHFTPRYDPWQQRLCLAPDGDFWAAIRSGRASVVTDHIEAITERGIRLRSGREFDADLVVTATGLVLKLLGGVQLTVDGARVDLGRSLTYKGVMFTDVPNLALAIGYTNASWTLKCELTAEWVCRLLNHMAARGYDEVRPRRPPGDVEGEPMLDFTSGYVLRAIDAFPKQGPTPPWRAFQNYLRDVWTVGWSRLEDGVLQFRSRPPRPHSATRDEPPARRRA
jgi:monooxygenase